jgi:hypothetical protein
LQTPDKRHILEPQRCSILPTSAGAYMPEIPGSFMPEGDDPKQRFKIEVHFGRLIIVHA